MRFYLISDNVDTQVGMRLAGIRGVVLHRADEVERELRRVCDNPEIGVILITSKLVELCPDLIYELKLTLKTPLIVEVSDRHGSGQLSETITRYVRESVGISL